MRTAAPHAALLTAELDYELPPELVARHPAAHRDDSRLLVLDRSTGSWQHRSFREISTFLIAGDCLVRNRTRVRPARTFGKRPGGGRVELVWLEQEGPTSWKALARPAARLKPGEAIVLEGGLTVTVHQRAVAGIVELEIPHDVDVEAWLELHGHMPIPPYLGRADEPEDRERYQTVFARETGAVAAPTAGLHFTQHTFDELARRGVNVADLLLHVGPGTFRPLSTDRVEDHRLDPEWYRIPASTWEMLQTTRAKGKRVVGVGTTVVRALESAGRTSPPALEGYSDLLISAPYEFGQVDALLTNFHLPRSSLLALVAAFAGLELVLSAYREAVREKYRFYSYGDAMLIV